MRKELSIIIPVFNAERWITDCLESLLHQTFKNFEAIIINDGSTDNSINIIKKYCEKDSHLYYISTKNQGSAMAKNLGLRYAKGELITFLDADDYIEKEMYQTMILNMHHSNADIVECGWKKINIYGRIVQYGTLFYEKICGSRECVTHFMKQANIGNYVWNKIYKRELFEGIRFPLLYFSEDYYMNAILHSKAKKKVIIPQMFYNYTIHPGQSTDNRQLNVKRIDGIKAGNMVADFFASNKRLKNYAALYSWKYALFIVDNMYGLDNKTVKNFIRHMKPELFKALTHISLDTFHNEHERKIVYQCFLLLIINSLFLDFKWMLE